MARALFSARDLSQAPFHALYRCNCRKKVIITIKLNQAYSPNSFYLYIVVWENDIYVYLFGVNFIRFLTARTIKPLASRFDMAASVPIVRFISVTITGR